MRTGLAVSALVAVIGACLVVPIRGQSQRKQAITNGNPLVGAWRLVSFESRTAVGHTRQLLGPSPKGQILYDGAGRMSVHLMNPDRPAFASGDWTRGTEAEARAAVSGYIGYYGTYTLDVGRGVVTHHLEGSLFPNWVGSDQVRRFRLEKDRLTLETPPMRVGGEESTTVLVWERIR